MPVSLFALPSGQLMQPTALVLGENVPCGQFWQVGAPWFAAYFPFTHSAHVVDPVLDDIPASQSSQVDWPGFSCAFPAGQPRQFDRSACFSADCAPDVPVQMNLLSTTQPVLEPQPTSISSNVQRR
jgi:hypothetical protein